MRLRIFCNDQCREAWRDDLRYGLVAGLDRFTDEQARERHCLYCGSYVPTNDERRQPAWVGRALAGTLPPKVLA